MGFTERTVKSVPDDGVTLKINTSFRTKTKQRIIFYNYWFVI